MTIEKLARMTQDQFAAVRKEMVTKAEFKEFREEVREEIKEEIRKDRRILLESNDRVIAKIDAL